MAISKILSIGSCGTGYAGKHLKQALDYIKEPYKTGNGKWVAALNCQVENAYEEMRQTKVQFGKTDKRQGYHMIISFVEDEVDAKTAFEVIGRFAKEYLGADYEAVYAVHDNTEHVHGHLIFNSVSFRDGKKYRYEKGDWAREIQPITNRLCEEYGLSTIEISEDRASPTEHYKEWNDFRDGKFVWADMIKRDIDACIVMAGTYEGFLERLSDMGYEIKNANRSEGKYLAIKPMGLTRFRRCKSLGEEYSEERIRERIQSENLATYQGKAKAKAPKIVKCRFKKYGRAKLSGIQKRYFAKMYRLGLKKKRPYSQAWKYRDDIRKMQKLQEDYLFLSRHRIQRTEEVAAMSVIFTDKKKEVSKEKSRVYKERARMKPLFDVVQDIRELQEMENCYLRGDMFFEEEHKQYIKLLDRLKQEGYTREQLEALQMHYRSKVASIRERENAIVKEERIAKRILEELLTAGATRKMERNAEKEEYRNKEVVKQPKR